MLDGFRPVPADRAARYRAAGLWRGEVLGAIGRGTARRSPRRVALVEGSRRTTYADLDAAADRVAGGLVRLGLRPGDRAVVQLPNVTEFAVVALGMFRAGVVPVLALPDHRVAEIRHLAAASGAVLYLTCDEHRGEDMRAIADAVLRDVADVRHVVVVGEPGPYLDFDDLGVDPGAGPVIGPEPSDVAFMLLSGGTTGMPKLIPRTHDDYALQLRLCAEALDCGADTVYLAAQSVAHNAALGCPGLLGTLAVGGTVVLTASPSPDEAFGPIAAEGVTLTTLMPPVLALWVELAPAYGLDLSRTTLQVGSATLAPELARRVAPETGARLSHWFGMAEGLLTCTALDDPAEVVATTQGKPISPFDEIRVVDEDGAEVPPGAVGELITRGPCTLAGYFRADEVNARAFTADGFLRTGDLVRLTPAGDMVVEGRRKDVINRGGLKIVPREVEDHLQLHPGLAAVAVVAVSDAVLGEKCCAVVVPRAEPAPDLAGVRAFLTDRGLAGFKLPDRLEIVDALPTTTFGKVDRVAVRRELVGG